MLSRIKHERTYFLKYCLFSGKVTVFLLWALPISTSVLNKDDAQHRTEMYPMKNSLILFKTPLPLDYNFPASGEDPPFSVASPTMILPPRLLVFSTDSAVLSPCSCFPRPWPSRKPYFCMILCATVPLAGRKRGSPLHLKSSTKA